MIGTTSRQGSLLAFGAVLLVVGAIACGNDGAGDADQALAARLATGTQTADLNALAALRARAGDGAIGVVHVVRLAPGGAAGYARFEGLLAPLRTAYGGTVRLRTHVEGIVIGDQRWDEVLVEIYPSAAAYVASLEDDGYAAAAREERAAVEAKTLLYGVNPLDLPAPTGTFRAPELEGLSRDEANALLDARIPPSLRGDANRETVVDLLVDDRPDEFFNVNLLDFRDVAAYPDGLFPGSTGLDANNRYNAVVLPELAQRNGGPVYFMNVAGVLVGDRSTWEQVGIVRYASAHAMVDMILDPDFQAGAVHKFASLEATEALYTRGELLSLP